MSLSFKNKTVLKKHGFSLVELIIVIAVMGILLIGLGTYFFGLMEESKKNSITAAAHVLNGAKSAYSTAAPNAATAWANAANDEARYKLLYDAKLLKMFPGSLSEFTPPDGTLTLGSSLDDRVLAMYKDQDLTYR